MMNPHSLLSAIKGESKKQVILGPSKKGDVNDLKLWKRLAITNKSE